MQVSWNASGRTERNEFEPPPTQHAYDRNESSLQRSLCHSVADSLSRLDRLLLLLKIANEISMLAT